MVQMAKGLNTLKEDGARDILAADVRVPPSYRHGSWLVWKIDMIGTSRLEDEAAQVEEQGLLVHKMPVEAVMLVAMGDRHVEVAVVERKHRCRTATVLALA